MSRTEDVTCLPFGGSKLFKYEDFSMEAFPKKCGLVLRDFSFFFGHSGSQKVLSSLSVVSVRVSSSYSGSSLKFFSSFSSVQEFSILHVRCSSVLIRSNSQVLRFSSSVRYFGSLRLSVFTEGVNGHFRQIFFPFCLFYFRGSSGKVSPNIGELRVCPVSEDEQEDGVIQVLQIQS